MNTRKIILITLMSILALQIFPFEGVTFLFVKIGNTRAIEKDFLLGNNTEDGSEEDPVKIKKIELVNELNTFSFNVSTLLITPNKHLIKIGNPVDCHMEVIIPPPNLM